MMKMNVEDITHHPKRTQAGNIEKAGTSYEKLVAESSVNSPVSGSSDIPVNVTIESAIQYFRSHTTGSLANLYAFTSDILEKYRVISKSAVSKAFEEAKKESYSNIVEVDISEGVSDK